MNPVRRKLFLRSTAWLLLLAVLSLEPVPPHRVVRAQSGGGAPQGTAGEIPFGGHEIVDLVCGCTGNVTVWVQDYATDRILGLVYQPGVSILYEFHNIFARYLLGSYIPGGGACEIYVGVACVDIHTDGMLGQKPGTGTSQ